VEIVAEQDRRITEIEATLPRTREKTTANR
jgi:hypothetical protein